MKKMDNKKVKELLELYFDAETTVEQERDLRLYFASGYADEEFKKYAPLFGYFSEEIVKANASSRSFRMKPRYLYFIPAAAAIALFTVLFWPQEQDTGGLRLVLDGLEIDNRQAAVSIADQKLAKFSEMMEKVENKAGSLEKLNRVEKALSGFNDLTSKIK
jgi:hypothetical protein